ncbi:MAG TPA: DUF2243 domain-containing protein [Pedobacter sp.]|nr:DUF2243 domain-containing protein [Pedobacter sp.]
MIKALPCCISCNKLIRDGIYNSAFYPNLLTLLSAFFVLAGIVSALAYLNGGRHLSRNAGAALSPVPLKTAGTVLGIGLGGFADGIVLHQLLQWHEMLSAKIPATDYIGKSVNMFWDGIFHLFCLLVVLIGVGMLWRALTLSSALKSGRILIGSMFCGWAIFNLIEGMLNHQLLGLHNVMEYAADHQPANYTYLSVSVLMLIFGMWLASTSYSRKH